MGLADSHGISRVPCYSGTTRTSTTTFAYGGITHSADASQRLRLAPLPSTRAAAPERAVPTTPDTQHLPAIPRIRFSLFPFRSPLLRESLLLSLPAGTEMFQFPALPPTALYIQTAATGHHSGQVHPFGHPGITARSATHPGLSQPPTSFIASWYQGIHRTPFKAYQHDGPT